jgi:hypothetical protein
MTSITRPKLTHPQSAPKPITGDDLITAFYQANPRDDTSTQAFFRAYSVKAIREAAELCGVDAAHFTRSQAIIAIVENF